MKWYRNSILDILVIFKPIAAVGGIWLYSYLSWCHIILTNIGVTSVSLLMIYTGYIGDTAMFPRDIGGFGMTSEQVSQNILNHFIIPIGVLLIVTTTGAICGGIRFIVAFIKKNSILYRASHLLQSTIL